MEHHENLTAEKTYKQGIMSALGCSVWWGIMPIYWQWLRPIDSSVIIFYRIFLVAAVCLIAALIKYKPKEIFEPLKDKKLVITYILAGIIITANWSIYIWAVNAEFIIQTCIGYYIEPLMVCIFGVVLFKEKLTNYKKIALAFAFLGVAVIIIYFKEVPLIALSLAITFSVYAAMKKNLSKPPILSLLYETIFIAPIALAVIIFIEVTGKGAIGVGEPYKYGLLMFCGLFTALPLGLFADAANKINLFVLGLTEYLSPTLSLIIGIYVLKEPFENIQLIAFGIIWIGLCFFSYGEFKDHKLAKKAKDTEIETDTETEADAETKADADTFFTPEDNGHYKNYPNHDRNDYPRPLVRVTAGMGGEAILILGSEKTVLYDCGMACFSDKLIHNIKTVLKRENRQLDYVIMSHTHYDHIGALPYILDEFPDVKVCGSGKAVQVFASEGAKATMVRLGNAAKKDYNCSDIEIKADNLRIDIILKDGDSISIGKGKDEKIVAYETKGHTDCSMSYLVLPQKILFAGESTGVHVGPDFIYTAILKSYQDAINSAEKLKKLDVNYIVAPHYGVLPQHINSEYFDKAIKAASEERNLIKECIKKGMSPEQIFEEHKKVYWSESRGKNQPYDSYKLNAEIAIKLIMHSN